MTISDTPTENSKQQIALLLKELGHNLGFFAMSEVEASEAAWVDVVWFDQRLMSALAPAARPKLRRVPILPVVAFEFENRTGLNAKHVKGSVSNLNNCGAELGVIVLGTESLLMLGKQAPHVKKTQRELEDELLTRAYRWVYAEAQPRGRVVVMLEREVREWAARATSKAQPNAA